MAGTRDRVEGLPWYRAARAVGVGVDLDAMDQMDTGSLVDRARCFVTDTPANKLYGYDQDSVAVPDGVNIVIPSSGVGRWLIIFADIADGTAEGQELTWDGTAWVAGREPNAAPPTIQLVGDSNTVGVNIVESGQIGGWRSAMYSSLRNWRDDFELVGTHYDAPELVSSFGAWFHDAVQGYTIGDVTANYAGWLVALGAPPAVVIDMIGTNNVTAGNSAAAMMVARAAMDAVVTASAPNARRIVLGVPPFVAGTSVGGNLAAWNAVRDAYNILLSAYCTVQGYAYLDYTDALGPGDYQADGIHLNRSGAGKLGQAVAEHNDRIVLGTRRGIVLPAAFREIKPQRSIYCPVNAGPLSSGKMTAANATAFQPDSSIAIAFDFFPLTLRQGNFAVVAEYGDISAPPNFWALLQNGTALNLYWNNAGGTITTQPQSQVIRQNTWHRIVIIAQLNGADSAVGLYVNGQLVGLATGLPAWNLTLKSTVFGAGPAFSVADPSYYSRIGAWKGAAIPRPGSMAAMRAVEGDYYLGVSLFEGLGVGLWPLGADLNDEISGGPAMTLAGGAVAVAAHPAGTPRRPWEMPILLPDKYGTMTLDAATPSVAVVGYTDCRANAPPKLTLVALGGTGTGLAPACVITPHGGATFSGPTGDSSIWAYEWP